MSRGQGPGEGERHTDSCGSTFVQEAGGMGGMRKEEMKEEEEETDEDSQLRKGGRDGYRRKRLPNIVITGTPGVGKSALSSRLVPLLASVQVDVGSDVFGAGGGEDREEDGEEDLEVGGKVRGMGGEEEFVGVDSIRHVRVGDMARVSHERQTDRQQRERQRERKRERETARQRQRDREWSAIWRG